MICCSFVPANWPRIVCVMAVGGWIEREYMNMDDVVAMMLERKAAMSQQSPHEKNTDS